MMRALIKFRLRKARQRSHFLDLPYELVWRITSFLSMGSLRNLMLNRSLRGICEDRLYASISLDFQPWRSTLLLKTFRLRPDLALRARHLEISVHNFNESRSQYRIQDVLGFDVAHGLSLAKNVRSLTLSHLPNWIHMPEQASFRAAVSAMELTHLTIQQIRHDDYSTISTDTRREENFFQEMLRILQAQPSLESLSLVYCEFSLEFLSDVEALLSRSDVPALRSLTARSDVAASFLTRISGLESITLALDEYPFLEWISMSMGTAENRASVRELTFRVPQKGYWARYQVSGLMALFPNVEKLSFILFPHHHSTWKEPEGVKDCLDMVTANIHILPSIRCLEIGYETDREIPNGWISVQGSVSALEDDQVIFEWLQEFVGEIKVACPQLEMFVDPKRRLWVYSLDSDSGGSGASAKLMGKLEAKQEGFVKDLPWTKRRPRRTLKNVLGWS